MEITETVITLAIVVIAIILIGLIIAKLSDSKDNSAGCSVAAFLFIIMAVIAIVIFILCAINGFSSIF